MLSYDSLIFEPACNLSPYLRTPLQYLLIKALPSSSGLASRVPPTLSTVPGGDHLSQGALALWHSGGVFQCRAQGGLEGGEETAPWGFCLPFLSRSPWPDVLSRLRSWLLSGSPLCATLSVLLTASSVVLQIQDMTPLAAPSLGWVH